MIKFAQKTGLINTPPEKPSMWYDTIKDENLKKNIILILDNIQDVKNHKNYNLAINKIILHYEGIYLENNNINDSDILTLNNLYEYIKFNINHIKTKDASREISEIQTNDWRKFMSISNYFISNQFDEYDKLDKDDLIKYIESLQPIQKGGKNKKPKAVSKATVRKPKAVSKATVKKPKVVSKATVRKPKAVSK